MQLKLFTIIIKLSRQQQTARHKERKMVHSNHPFPKTPVYIISLSLAMQKHGHKDFSVTSLWIRRQTSP